MNRTHGLSKAFRGGARIWARHGSGGLVMAYNLAHVTTCGFWKVPQVFFGGREPLGDPLLSLPNLILFFYYCLFISMLLYLILFILWCLK